MEDLDMKGVQGRGVRRTRTPLGRRKREKKEQEDAGRV